jgi:hypothetical protein
MTALDEFRSDMNAYRREVDEEARSFKDSSLAIEKLKRFYDQLSPEEKNLADQVLAEWALSDDEATRFNALALIDEFKLTATLQVLYELATRLGSSKEPSAPFELRKLSRIINNLGG